MARRRSHSSTETSWVRPSTGTRVPVGGGSQRAPDGPRLDQAGLGEERRVEEGDQFGHGDPQPGPGDGRGGQRLGRAPAVREFGDPGPFEHRTQHLGAGAGAYPECFGERAAGAHHLVVEVRGVQALEADLGGLFEDAEVGG
ncbi:hypothetical protein GA0115236_12381, partial [Streptomyces sp. IgraMP-1]